MRITPNLWLKNLRVGHEHDNRIRLTDNDKKDIRARHASGEYIRSIARAYAAQCTRRTIQFVLFPERLKAARKNRDWTAYYTKEKHRNYMRKHRAHLKELREKGLATPYNPKSKP